MKIAIIGATGHVGTCLVSEALQRGHSVTAIARDVARVPASERLTAVAGDAAAPAALAPLLAAHDAVISSVRFVDSDPGRLLEAVRRAGVKRYLVVGGAGSLASAPGAGLVVDSPEFPAVYLAEARAGKAFLDALRPVQDLEWTMLSPSALFTSGERTGRFRLGDDTLLVGSDGKSWISYQDFAVAMLDEVERPAHVRARFTVGY